MLFLIAQLFGGAGELSSHHSEDRVTSLRDAQTSTLSWLTSQTHKTGTAQTSSDPIVDKHYFLKYLVDGLIEHKVFLVFLHENARRDTWYT